MIKRKKKKREQNKKNVQKPLNTMNLWSKIFTPSPTSHKVAQSERGFPHKTFPSKSNQSIQKNKYFNLISLLPGLFLILVHVFLWVSSPPPPATRCQQKFNHSLDNQTGCLISIFMISSNFKSSHLFLCVSSHQFK